MLDDSLQNPTKILYNKKENKFLIKKLYKKSKKQHFLVIIISPEHKPPKIITVIDTSKVKKYL